MGALLLAAFGLLALFLAAVGLYAVLAFATARRTREVGIRLALGADTHHVFGLVVRDGMRLLGVGIVLGLAGAAVAARSIESFLYGVPPLDSLTFVGVVLLLSVVAFLACLVPARRAMKVDPTVSLRST
jgi:putative ABC transport system permease protein